VSIKLTKTIKIDGHAVKVSVTVKDRSLLPSVMIIHALEAMNSALIDKGANKEERKAA
jgi:hypothetical protein